MLEISFGGGAGGPNQPSNPNPPPPVKPNGSHIYLFGFSWD